MSDVYGIKVSRQGHDVKSAADTNLSFSSEFNTLKIAKIIDMTTETEVAHGLGYIPTFVFLRCNKAGEYMMGNPPYTEGMLSSVYVDGTNIYKLVAAASVAAYVVLFSDKLDE